MTKTDGSEPAELPAETDRRASRPVGSVFWWLAISSAVVLWISQPPVALWPIAFVALVPYLAISDGAYFTRRHALVLFAATFAYWAVTLQGLRHAHPVLIAAWIALAFYLAVYRVVFVLAVRRLFIRSGASSDGTASKFLGSRSIPALVAVPLLWVGMECIRNYVMTGISAVMLGHTMADVPAMIQIADLGGSYAVSWVVAVVNVAIYQLLRYLMARMPDRVGEKPSFPFASVVCAVVLLGMALGYGQYRLSQPTSGQDTAFALIGMNEPIEYEQDASRELEIFAAYARKSVECIQQTDTRIDAVVWPESMFTGTLPWIMGEASGAMAAEQQLSKLEFDSIIRERQRAYTFRANRLQTLMADFNEGVAPDLIVGCGVFDYGETSKAYSGIVHIGAEGNPVDWYGKTHLVLFGEYFPLVRYIPVLKDMIPKEVGLTRGQGAKVLNINDLRVCPNICIETAVERVTVNHFRELRSSPTGDSELPDVVVTVTNDGWFDDSSIIQHHKRCAQLVAVACRRPILSAANNGPTAWIDSYGRVHRELPQGNESFLIANPDLDSRTSPVLILGDWPARISGLLLLAVFVIPKRKVKETA